MTLFKPNRPRAPTPVDVTVEVVTPEVAQRWQTERPNFQIFGYNDQDWLTMGGWLADIERYVLETSAIFDYYEQFNKVVDE